MKYLLLATIIFWGLFVWSYVRADRPGDDFGAGALAFLLLIVCVVLTVVYIAIALWTRTLL